MTSATQVLLERVIYNSGETRIHRLSEDSETGSRKPAFLHKVFANPSTSKGKFHHVNVYALNMNIT